MTCPYCKEINNVYFDGAFIVCHRCGKKEWLNKNKKIVLEKWSIKE